MPDDGRLTVDAYGPAYTWDSAYGLRQVRPALRRTETGWEAIDSRGRRIADYTPPPGGHWTDFPKLSYSDEVLADGPIFADDVTWTNVTAAPESIIDMLVSTEQGPGGGAVYKGHGSGMAVDLGGTAEALAAAARYVSQRYGVVSRSWERYAGGGYGQLGRLPLLTDAQRARLFDPAENARAALRHYSHFGPHRIDGGAIGFEGALRWPKSWGDPELDAPERIDWTTDHIRASLTTHRPDEGNTMATPPSSTPYDCNIGQDTGMMMRSLGIDPDDAQLMREAEGLTASDLDRLARERWVAGHKRGERKANAANAETLPEAWREGWTAGSHVVPGRLAEQLGERAHLVHLVAESLASQSPLVALRLTDEGHAKAWSVVGQVMGDLLAEFNDENERPPEHRTIDRDEWHARFPSAVTRGEDAAPRLALVGQLAQLEGWTRVRSDG